MMNYNREQYKEKRSGVNIVQFIVWYSNTEKFKIEGRT
jgi:hypothetical protein